ncbi:taste receptor type 1 member 1-like [Oryzias melastigma]|uniref:Taste receptor type 1 member 1-like n=1 Tax=Oryzias melastigma TaxID=30732 RepID=A0A3B3BF48_ORYME|nr:taste receptor type 1 member 1-like [Oryzias melastigma]
MFRLIFVSLSLLGCNLHTETKCIPQTSEFKKEGDYLLGGLFDVHHVRGTLHLNIPEAVLCSSQEFTLSSYRRFQMMRFSIEEINNSTSLLPNVTLGYEIFDHCSDTKNFPSIFRLMSVNGSVQPWKESANFSKVIAMVGTYTSTATLTVAPLFMMDLIPMISYGAASSVFSRKQNFPSFLRTVHPNKDVIEIICKLLEEFKWTWVAFLYIDDDYGRDGLDVFVKKIKDTKICMAFNYGLSNGTDYPKLFKEIKSLNVNVIIVFTAEWTAEDLINSAIQQNVKNKVWIAADAWSLHKELPKKAGIRNIGTVLGVAEPKITIPGFNDFIYSFKAQNQCENPEQDSFCNQMCNCSSLSAENITTADPSFNFPVYSAVYAVAHALHAVLQCGADSCNKDIKVHPDMVLKELKKSDFTLLNHRVQFDDNGDPKFGPYAIVFWNKNSNAEEIGSYTFHPKPIFKINKSKIHWHRDGQVPKSFCSEDCPDGHKKKQEGFHKCCFSCTICPKETYLNNTDPYNCISCKETEWSPAGSTSCFERKQEYVPFNDPGAIGVMVGTLILLIFIAAISVLFALNYNTPVVKSAGGPMCFLILGCLSLCSISVFFYFGEPRVTFCVLRFVPFLLFYTVCLACFAVRSFQIVCIFKISAKFPNISRVWTKYHAHWIFIAAASFLQAILLITHFSLDPPKQFKDTFYSDRFILGCDFDKTLNDSLISIILAFILILLSFCFSYTGKNLPKNYNEAKAITFCMFLLILIWISFATFIKLFHGKSINVINASAVLLSLYSYLLGYFFPKCYIILFKPEKNTEQYFQDLIQCYTRSASSS